MGFRSENNLSKYSASQKEIKIKKRVFTKRFYNVIDNCSSLNNHIQFKHIILHNRVDFSCIILCLCESVLHVGGCISVTRQPQNSERPILLWPPSLHTASHCPALHDNSLYVGWISKSAKWWFGSVSISVCLTSKFLIKLSCSYRNDTLSPTSMCKI